MIRVVDGLYRLESGGFVNSYLIESGGDLTIVDTGHSRSAGKLLEEIKSNGFPFRDIGRIVLTHAHADHVGGVAALLERHPLKIYAHPKEIPILEGKAALKPFKGFKGFVMGVVHKRMMPWPPMHAVFPLEPDRPIRGMAQWQVLHTPGHTAGSLSLYNPAKQVLICGDVVSHRKGRLQLPDACYNGNAAVLRRSLEEIAQLDTDILCPGHGTVLRGGAFRYIEALLVRRRTR